MNHWAYSYIGKPWRRCATGPDAYHCWGLVQELAASRLGAPLPPLGEDSNEQNLRTAVVGWERALEPKADDIVVMMSPSGRHVGFMVEANGRLGVLHANGWQTPKGPTGCVMFQSLAELSMTGHSQYEFWRKQCKQ